MSTGTLVVRCRSARFGDFHWAARRLAATIQGPLAMERCATVEAFQRTLGAAAPTAPRDAVHLFAELHEGALAVAPGTRLGSTEVASALRRGGDPARIHLWLWSEDAQAAERFAIELRTQLGFPVRVESLIALKTAHRPAGRPTSQRGADARGAPLLVYGMGGAFLLSVIVLLQLVVASLSDSGPGPGPDPDVVSASRAWRPPASVEALSGDRWVEYQWEFERVEWHAQWLVLASWLEDSERELRALAKRDFYPGFWDDAFRTVAHQNDPRVVQVAETFREFGRRHDLDRLQLATLALRFVQTIRYREPSGRLGLLTPPQMLVERYGDCDTKSMLYILLLRQLDIDATLLLSERYRHAMAGVALSVSGRYMTAGGRRYYFTETTNLGFPIGELPSGVTNTFFWRVVDLDAPPPRP